jgi:hypothetical protein
LFEPEAKLAAAGSAFCAPAALVLAVASFWL